MLMDVSTLILPALVSAVGVLVLILYRGPDTRLASLEGTSESRSNSDQQRAGIREDLDSHAKRDEDQNAAVQGALREFRVETREQFVALRAEANEKRAEMRNDVLNQRTETNAKLEKLSDQVTNLSQSLRPRRSAR